MFCDLQQDDANEVRDYTWQYDSFYLRERLMLLPDFKIGGGKQVHPRLLGKAVSMYLRATRDELRGE